MLNERLAGIFTKGYQVLFFIRYTSVWPTPDAEWRENVPYLPTIV
ncbi:hypothetical protein [Spirosoma horti]